MSKSTSSPRNKRISSTARPLDRSGVGVRAAMVKPGRVGMELSRHGVLSQFGEKFLPGRQTNGIR
jgi:hypothetical protein